MPPVTRRDFIRQTAAAAIALSGPSRLPAASAAGRADLRLVMDRAVKCCLAWLDPKAQFLPTGGWDIAHDTGRWWDAMLRYEAVTGVPIPQWAEDAMMKNVRALSDNRAALLTDKLCHPHNLRESMLAYTELVRHRQSDWARQQGSTLVETMHRLLEPDGQMDYTRLAELSGKPLSKDALGIQRSAPGEWFNATGATGRAIESIVWFHEATGEARALELAKRLSETQLRQSIDPSGKIRAELLNPGSVGHTHSYCGTLRGLLLYGFASGERKYIDAIANTYRHGLWGSSISRSGWTPHDQGKLRFPNKEGDPVAEHASCGDIAQIALWLALRDGQTDLLDDVERLIRARLLTSQVVDAEKPRRDGAWGVYGDPFGFGAIFDVLAAVLHTLVDAQEHIVTTRNDTVSINLHFDIDTPAVTVRSDRSKDASLLVTAKASREIRIRIPAWATRESVRLSLDGQPLPLHLDGPYAVIGKDESVVGRTIELQHDLPPQETVEEMPISHRKFRLSWRGDEVISCDPKVAIYLNPSGQ